MYKTVLFCCKDVSKYPFLHLSDPSTVPLRCTLRKTGLVIDDLVMLTVGSILSSLDPSVHRDDSDFG
jgi:hypothetical protein